MNNDRMTIQEIKNVLIEDLENCGEVGNKYKIEIEEESNKKGIHIYVNVGDSHGFSICAYEDKNYMGCIGCGRDLADGDCSHETWYNIMGDIDVCLTDY